MANCNKIDMRGWMPFDAGYDGAMNKMLGLMNTPHYGFRIRYVADNEGQAQLLSPNTYGGKTTYVHFTITGTEGMWASGLERMIRDFEERGCLFYHAIASDIDCGDPRWYGLTFTNHGSSVDIKNRLRAGTTLRQR